jgi:hypothetical protein
MVLQWMTPYHITARLTKQALWKLPRILGPSQGAKTNISIMMILNRPIQDCSNFIVKHI